MSHPFHNNWACTLMRKQIKAGASAKDIATMLSEQREFVDAIQEAIDAGPLPDGMYGADQAENSVLNLCKALQKVPSC